MSTPSDPDRPAGVTRSVTTNPDGSVTESTTFTLGSGGVRPVDEAVVDALDAALSAHGEVMHAIDPSRMLRFDAGGPSVWSVGVVRVEGERPYWLYLTYGFSERVTAVEYRAGWTHEYSLALPDTGDGPPIWGVPLLRHLARYVLKSRAELRVGDNMPCHAPITRIAFSPAEQGSVRSTPMEAVLVAADPLLGAVDTPAGPVEVRRIVGVLPEELALVETWNCAGFVEEWRKDDPALVTDVDRTTVLTGDLDARCRARAAKEGGSVGWLYADCAWRQTEEGALDLHFPGGPQARQILAVIRARLPFGRPVTLQGPPGAGAIRFVPEAPFSVEADGDTIVLYGAHDGPELAQVLSCIREDAPDGSVLRFG